MILNPKHEDFEKLFLCPKTNQFIYIQYLSDDPEYDFDYTIFDDQFNDIDGGVIGQRSDWDLKEAAIEATGDYSLVEKDLDYYRKAGIL